MTQNDLDAVIALERAAYPFPWSLGSFRDCLRMGYCCRVMEEPPDLLGYGIVSMGGGEAELLNLCIRREARNRGLARRLLAHLMDVAREGGADSLFLEVRPSNHAARALYEGMGFNEVGLRGGYYPAEKGSKKGSEDALILGACLTEA